MSLEKLSRSICKRFDKEQRLLLAVQNFFDRTYAIILDENINRLFGYPSETTVAETRFNGISSLGLGVSSIVCVATSNLRYCFRSDMSTFWYEMWGAKCITWQWIILTSLLLDVSDASFGIGSR